MGNSKNTPATGIYKITNALTDMVYVGQTSVNFKGRWRSHVLSLEKGSHGNPYLQRAWNKYGAQAFIFSVEIYIENKELEQFYRDLDRSERETLLLYPNHYNLMEAGEDRMIFSEESRNKASLSAKNRKITDAERSLWEGKRLAATRSEEARQKRSVAHKSIWAIPEKREMFIEAYNRPETFEKKSKSIKASWTLERREKQIEMNISMFQDSVIKEKHRNSVKTAHDAPGGFEKYSEAMKRGWIKRKANMQKPEYQAKEAERIQKIKATKARKKAEREALKNS